MTAEATQVYSGSKPSGTYTFPFNRTSLPVGQYTTTGAAWSPPGGNATGAKAVSFLVMGQYLHTQYNTPNESACVGNPAAAYVTNPSCAFNPASLKSDFIGQSWLNGSGIAINYGMEQNEAWCIQNGYGPPDASGRSFRPQAIVPWCGGGFPVNNTTLAKGDDAPLICNDQVLIVGLGGSGAVKTVTDRCPLCTSQLRLDNYTTQAACQPGSIPSLGTFTTIRLR